MTIIHKLGMAVLAAALPASAMAFPYSVAPHNPQPSQAGKIQSIAVSSHGIGLGEQAKTPSPKQARKSH